MTEIFSLKNFEFQCGKSLSAAQIVYQTYGNLNADRFSPRNAKGKAPPKNATLYR